MKLNVCCEEFKPLTKTGLKEKCNCKYLSRNFGRDLKLYLSFMKKFDRKGK